MNTSNSRFGRVHHNPLPFLFLPPLLMLSSPAVASVLTFGDKDLDGYGYPGGVDPTLGATLEGLLPDATSQATNAYNHGFPFAPAATDYPGTDQIYVGTVQTSSRDGYSSYSGRLHGPQVITLDYSSLVPAGQSITTFTLGLGADDFQFPSWNDPFTASINGTVNTVLTNLINGLSQTGPYERFITVGINPAVLLPTNTLTLSINEGGDGGDGWALDFLTVGITTSNQAIWLGGTGTWSTAAKWTTNPNVPNNGSPPGALYDVLIPTGTVNLDINPAVQSLSFGSGPTFTSTLNLATSKLIVQSSNAPDKSSKISSLTQAIHAGSNSGAWNGPGITSSAAAGDASHYGVGLFDNAILGLTTFGGTPADNGSILLTVAHLGDANDNGIVDIQDQSIVTNHWQTAQNNWAAGDLNLDGFVDLQDLTLVTNNWQQTSIFGAAPSGLSVSSVPEPFTLPLLGLPMLALLRRTKRPLRS